MSDATAALDSARMLELMAVDKKVEDGKMRLVLLKDIGRAVITDNTPLTLVKATLAHCREPA